MSKGATLRLRLSRLSSDCFVRGIEMTGAEIFIRFRQYVAYMDIVHPGLPRLNYRAWLDFGNREGV